MSDPRSHKPPTTAQEESFERPVPEEARAASSGPTAFAHFKRTLKSGPALTALGMLWVILFVAFSAPLLGTTDPIAIDPGQRLKLPSGQHWLGTDAYGRDVYSRVVYGSRISLKVGLGTSLMGVAIGLLIGVIAGYIRVADAIVMRVMDGLMAIPGILLAIALMAVTQASLTTVIVAITIPEIPRVARLVRSLALTLREQLFVEAAHAVGTRLPVILWRHVLPNTVAPLVVQATFVAASAVLIEAALSFLGVGVPAQTPSWGNMMAEGRNFVAVAFHIILYPGILLALTVLAINLLGDGLRDALDPRLARQL